jgi:carbamoyl-phosphate synthase large subunit
MFGAYLPRKPRCVLILGSGALQIGQAGEFDYSGSQAIKALKEEHIRTVLVNPNIATIQTSAGLADRVYLVAVIPEFVERVIAEDEVDAILLSFGGQTALNCGLELHRRGVLDRHGVRVLGTPIEAIENTEDRHLFVKQLDEIGVKTPRSIACHSYSLGGKGSDIVRQDAELDHALRRSFDAGTPQVLVEEYLHGWKEVEYEIVRDGRDNCIAVCNMENFDPMGIHTGESIVVAPSQTLTNEEYQWLRTVAIKTVRHLGIVGECNIQYALDPTNGATGYPLAYVAAKIAIGYSLPEIPNAITRRTTSFFEPSLDYLVCKIPRWDTAKFRDASSRIGTEMKSVGEVMAIGRTFPEVIQKALRMLDIGVSGLDPDAFEFKDLKTVIKNATTLRIFAIARALREGMSIENIHELSGIDPWFLSGLQEIVDLHQTLAQVQAPLDEAQLRRAKELGFSDKAIDRLTGAPAEETSKARRQLGTHRYDGGGVSRRNELPLFHLQGHHQRNAEGETPEDHGAGVRALPHRLERRI